MFGCGCKNIRQLKSFLKNTWWIWLLLIITLFAFPLKIGLKSDPAQFASMARKILDTGIWWPISFREDFFPVWYNHPPGTIWGMAITMFPFPNHNWFVPLFSRLCILLAYVIYCHGIIRYLQSKKLASKVIFAYVTLFLLFTHTWMTWLKYVGDAQREGSFSVALALTFTAVLLLYLKDGNSKNKFACLVLAGFLGFLFKAAMYPPFVIGLFLWGIFEKRLIVLIGCVFSTIGWGLGLGFMLMLDSLYKTKWVHHYFYEVALKTALGGNQFSEPMALKVETLWNSFKGFLIMQSTYAAIWFYPLCVLIFYKLYRKNLFKDPLIKLGVIVFVLFLTPIAFASFKLAHHPVPIYPMGALILALSFPLSWVKNIAKAFEGKKLKRFSLGMVLLAAILPYPTMSKYGRGESWYLLAPMIKEHCTKDYPLRVVKHKKNEGLWGAYVYSHYFLGHDFPIEFKEEKEHLKEMCEGGILVNPAPQVSLIDDDIAEEKGWFKSAYQAPGLETYHCQ